MSDSDSPQPEPGYPGDTPDSDAAAPAEPTAAHAPTEPTTAHAPYDPAAQHPPFPHYAQYAAPAPNPFVPRYREPWVNPARKGAALALAAAAAVVLLALGFLLGLGLGGHRHGVGPRHEMRVVLRHPGRFGPPHGFQGYRPRGVVPRRHPAAPAPTPVPTTSHS